MKFYLFIERHNYTHAQNDKVGYRVLLFTHDYCTVGPNGLRVFKGVNEFKDLINIVQKIKKLIYMSF